MEENEIVEPVEQTEEEYLQCEVETSPYNKNERFIPTEYHYDIDFQKSWKNSSPCMSENTFVLHLYLIDTQNAAAFVLF